MQNQSHLKNLFSHTIFYGIGIALNKSVSFILLPVYTKYFSTEQIGLFTLIQSISFFLGLIYMLGVETSFMKFFIASEKRESKSEVYTSSLMLLSVTSIIFSLLIYFNADGISNLFNFKEKSESVFLIKILSVLMVADTLYRFPLLLFRAELNTRIYVLINLLTFFINITSSCIFIIVMKMGIEAIFYSSIISVLITFIIGLFLTRKFISSKINLDRIKELLVFGNKFVYIGIFILLIDVSDRFFLKYFYDESVVGIYSANYRLASVMGLIIAAFRFSWTPYFLNLKENPENKKIISSIFTYYVFAGLLMFLFFSLLTNPLVKISFFGYNFLNENFWSGLKIVPLILFAYFFSGLYAILNAAPFFTNNTGSLLAISLSGLIINLLFNFLLIPQFEMTGAALSTLITYFGMFLIIFYYSQKIYRINFEWKRISVMIMLSAAVFIAGYFFVNSINLSPASDIILNLFLLAIFVCGTALFKVIDLRKINLLWKK